MHAAKVRACFYGAASIVAALAACNDPFALGDPIYPNVVDTVSLWAASGTALHLPSAYVLARPGPVRPDLNVDFVFDIDAADEAQLLPTGALDLGRASGIMLTTEPFDSIHIAPTAGYQDSLPVAVAVGDVALVRAREFNCSLNYQIPEPLYAKLQVLTIDLLERRVDFAILVNLNCGYRGLDTGLTRR